MKQSNKPAHLELEPSEVKMNWKRGFYSPPGYLYHLFLAMKRAGWWISIDNVSQFCEEWEINRRTFYRAKAKLIDLGMLEENITGIVKLRLLGKDCDSSDTPVTPVTQCDSSDTPVTNESLSVTDLSLSVSDGSHSVTPVTHSRLKTTDSIELQEPPRSSSDLPSDLSLKEPSEREKNIDPEYRTWLDRKASRLPNPPTLKEQWIRKQAQVEANRIEFQAEQQKRNSSAASPPEQFQIECAVEQALRGDDRGFAIAKLENLWADGWQDTVENLIQTHPEWRFELRDTGPVDVGA